MMGCSLAGGRRPRGQGRGFMKRRGFEEREKGSNLLSLWHATSSQPQVTHIGSVCNREDYKDLPYSDVVRTSNTI